MKLGEIIDYMMENEIVSTIKRKDIDSTIIGGFIKSDLHTSNSEEEYTVTVVLHAGAVSYPIIQIRKNDWGIFNNESDNKTFPDSSYRWLSYEYEDVFSNKKTSVKEFNSILNIKRRCEYDGSSIIMINLL